MKTVLFKTIFIGWLGVGLFGPSVLAQDSVITGTYQGVLLPALRSPNALGELLRALKITREGTEPRTYFLPLIRINRDFSPGAPPLFPDFEKAWSIREYSLNLTILI